MQHAFELTGMSSGACLNRVLRALQPLADELNVTLNPPRANLIAQTRPSEEAVRAALAKAGDYRARAL